MSVLPQCMSEQCMCAPCPQKPEEVIESHGTGLTNVGAAMWVLEIKHGSFETAISDLNNSAISQG